MVFGLMACGKKAEPAAEEAAEEAVEAEAEAEPEAEPEPEGDALVYEISADGQATGFAPEEDDLPEE